MNLDAVGHPWADIYKIFERVEGGRSKARCQYGELGKQHKKIQSKEEKQRNWKEWSEPQDLNLH